MENSWTVKMLPSAINEQQSNNSIEDQEESANLLFLPNECLHELFDCLDLLSLCQLAEVCQRFQSIAESAFQKRFAEFDYKDVQYKRSLFRRVLCKFGHLIHSIDDGWCFVRTNEEIDVYAIAVYCVNLKVLVVRGATFDCSVSKTLFSNLRTLKIVLCDFIGDEDLLFSKCRKLEELLIHHTKPSGFLERKFPKLVSLNFDSTHEGSETTVKMLSLNPQLQRVIIPTGMDDHHISVVVEHASNLNTLRFFSGLMTNQATSICSEQGFLQMSQLKQLKGLGLETNIDVYINLVGKLMNAFFENKVNIEVVYLRCFSISPRDLRCFIDLKTITVLHLHEVQPCSDDDLTILVKGLPTLMSLGLLFGNSTHNPLSTEGLINAVDFGEQLQHIYLNGVQKFTIDQNLFNILMEAHTNNLPLKTAKMLYIWITACKCNSTHSIPLDIQLKFIRELKFSLTFSHKKCLNCI